MQDLVPFWFLSGNPLRVYPNCGVFHCLVHKAPLSMLHVEDKALAMSDGRTLAYADNGNTSSLSVIIFFHGAFTVGDASRLPHALIERNVHFIAPSLPGWGKSSPIPKPASTYAITLASDITTLIKHLHPQSHDKLRLYFCGHSFGTIPAQILYGLDHTTFSLGKQLVGLVLLAPHSPPHCHLNYAQSMSWTNYITAGPPSLHAPFNFIMYLIRFAIASSLSSESSAQAFMSKNLANTMADEEERELYAQWREEQGLDDGQFERDLGRNAHRSVSHSWRGFLDMPFIYHSGWGNFSIQNIESHCPVLIVSSTGDRLAPLAMAQWISNNYTSATLKVIPGGHASAFFHLDSIWNQAFAMAS